MNTSNLSNLARQPLVIGLLSLIVGLALGLFYAWQIDPVDWINADASYLREDLQKDYVRMVAASYQADLDATKAAQRLAGLGPRWQELLNATLAESQGPEQARVQQLKNLSDSLVAAGQFPTPVGAQAPSGLGSLLLPIAACLLVIMLGLGGGLLFLRSRGALPATRATGMPSFVRAPVPAASEMPADTSTQAAPAIARFMSTYTLGDDAYDDSFSIDGPDGNFLGECGAGISEPIGVGDPKKVTAFEVWLFDKNDIRTVTKVIMSEHAFRDEALKSRLAAKGEPVLAVPGDTISLETATLVVTARVVDMAYGGGALPPNSFFERMTIELQAYRKTQPAPAAA